MSSTATIKFRDGVGRVTRCAPCLGRPVNRGAHGVTRPTLARNLIVAVLAVTAAFCLQTTPALPDARAESAETQFPYVIEPESGATEFATGDGIVITSFRGDRPHLEPGGRYRLEGSYTLTSAGSADLAWFATSRGPSGSTPVADREHVTISRGSGKFHLEKTLLDDGWLHVSFYVNGHSHGGIYFGEKGFDKTVLRQKGWSDFSSASPPEKPGLRSADVENARLLPSDPANAAIIAYLGQPVVAPANLDPKYVPANLVAAFTAMSKKAGWRIQKLAVDDSEFPFLVYGVLAGRHELVEKDIRAMKGYDYGGSVRGSTEEGATYFSLNMIPRDQYPSGQAAACNRRLMVRLQMLADAVRQAR